ncbi:MULTISPECIES: STAS domain-containing protein [Actinoplanes]|uniref:Anti-sigma factor antagonist n=2 Tax=Actinoplanes TaxID=1865 RepID=A0A117MKG5_9ACTN|nr:MULTISPECIES: STAS domain-containing protein [Actinoplanes]KUL22329.1 hypothetical protein ADL15_48200 [Actinoplanes awajinensis subsp. mycoplanecinus]GIE72759.1 hypothetical protein Apa02nite_088670 [Actinoplanes palleronii]
MDQPPLWRHHLTSRSGVVTIALSGELDLACTSTVQSLLFDQAQSPEVEDVRVDLAEVAFLDSSALGVLVGAFHYAQEQGCGFAVVNPSPVARRVLAMTGLTEVLVRP